MVWKDVIYDPNTKTSIFLAENSPVVNHFNFCEVVTFSTVSMVQYRSNDFILSALLNLVLVDFYLSEYLG